MWRIQWCWFVCFNSGTFERVAVKVALVRAIEDARGLIRALIQGREDVRTNAVAFVRANALILEVKKTQYHVFFSLRRYSTPKMTIKTYAARFHLKCTYVTKGVLQM